MNANERLRRIEGALLPRLRARQRPNLCVRPAGEPMRLPADATPEQVRTCATVAAMDATIPGSPLE